MKTLMLQCEMGTYVTCLVSIVHSCWIAFEWELVWWWWTWWWMKGDDGLRRLGVSLDDARCSDWGVLSNEAGRVVQMCCSFEWVRVAMLCGWLMGLRLSKKPLRNYHMVLLGSYPTIKWKAGLLSYLWMLKCGRILTLWASWVQILCWMYFAN